MDLIWNIQKMCMYMILAWFISWFVLFLDDGNVQFWPGCVILFLTWFSAYYVCGLRGYRKVNNIYVSYFLVWIAISEFLTVVILNGTWPLSPKSPYLCCLLLCSVSYSPLIGCLLSIYSAWVLFLTMVTCHYLVPCI